LAVNTTHLADWVAALKVSKPAWCEIVTWLMLSWQSSGPLAVAFEAQGSDQVHFRFKASTPPQDGTDGPGDLRFKVATRIHPDWPGRRGMQDRHRATAAHKVANQKHKLCRRMNGRPKLWSRKEQE